MVLPTMTNIKPMYLSRDALAALWPLEEKLQRGADNGILAAASQQFPDAVSKPDHQKFLTSHAAVCAGGQSLLQGCYIAGAHDASLALLLSDAFRDGRRHLWHMYPVSPARSLGSGTLHCCNQAELFVHATSLLQLQWYSGGLQSKSLQLEPPHFGVCEAPVPQLRQQSLLVRCNLSHADICVVCR